MFMSEQIETVQTVTRQLYRVTKRYFDGPGNDDGYIAEFFITARDWQDATNRLRGMMGDEAQDIISIESFGQVYIF